MGYDVVSAVNNAGNSIGYTEVAPDSYEAVLWNAAGAAVLAETNDAFASINNAGNIGGDTVIGSSVFATEWAPNGSILWQGGTWGEIVVINKYGAAAGYTSGTDNTPAYWSPTGQEALLQHNGTIKSGKYTETQSTWSDIVAINDFGQIFGYAGFGKSYHESTDAVRWDGNGQETVLALLPGTTSSFPAGYFSGAMNDRGICVGSCENANETIATRWNANGTAINLGKVLGPDWSQTVAYGINNADDIIGSGDYNGTFSAFELLWVPKAGSADNGSYVNASSPNALAASAVHEHAAQAWSAVGHSSS